MNCQNCKHWVDGYCMVTGSLVDKDVLCNAWELSLSWEQVAETQPVTDRTAELKVGGYFVDLEAERDSYRERCKELESRLDLYYGNAYDVVVDENAKLIARVAKLERRITEAKALLEVEMGEWGATENFYLPDHFLQLRKALDVLDGE